MPSMFGERPSGSSSSAQIQNRPFSRVNSFKRDWDEEPKPPSGLKGSSTEIHWSPSPEPEKPKIMTAAPAESAAQRRRLAILAGMNTNAPPVAAPRAPAPQSVPRLPPPQQLPSLPSSSTSGARYGENKKRAMPWEEDTASAKKTMKMPAVEEIKRPGSAMSTNSTGSNSSDMRKLNIKQKITLSVEQQKVLAMVVDGKNMFFTGSAGTGKSVLLREIIKALRKKYVTSPDAVAVTASTGIAACNIGGVTLHSFGGVGLANEEPEVMITKLKKNKKAAARWQRTKVLIIDEVSMVDGDLFDRFCKLGQMMRKNKHPWGGIQIIVTGDFFQLPPVTRANQTPKFCFEAATWDETISLSVNLTRVFRQKDQTFVDMLNEMRFGKLSLDSIQRFKKLSRPIIYDDGIEPTELFPRREDVDRSNAQRLAALLEEGYTYNAVDGGTVTDYAQREKILSNFMAPQSLTLRTNAQVMLIKNVDETLVNGSMGRVLGFCHKQFYFTDTAGRWLPEGPSYDDLDAVAREKLEKTREKISESLRMGGSRPNPVVRFSVPGGGRRDMCVDVDSFKVELPNGEVQASRNQLPLILAWAMSIHKSQGQTLDRVKVDLGKVFEKGQAYVALSRATSLEGLQVLGFSADKVMAHRKVAVWSTKLRDLNDA